MTNSPTTPEWYTRFRSIANLRPDKRGNIAAVLVVLDRLKVESELRNKLAEILTEIPREEWRGWAALSLVVTKGEGQIAEVTGERVSRILRQFGIAANYVGTDGGRTSRGNFQFVRQLLGLLPAKGVLSPAIESELRLAQEDLINTLVAPELRDNYIKIQLSPNIRPEIVISDLLKQAGLRNMMGGVAQHLVGAKLARRFHPSPIDNFSVFASDIQLQRMGDFVREHEVFHVTVVSKPTKKMRQRLNQNREQQVSITLLVPRHVLSNYESLATDFDARLRSIEEYVGDNLMEMGDHNRDKMHQELLSLIDTYNSRVVAVERGNSGLEVRSHE